jgi:ferredoxin
VPTYVILLDHGRSRIWNSPFRPILRCIRCGACSSVCPVFRVGGGNRLYRSPYGGAMGKVLNPLLWGYTHRDLPNRSLLCGFCDAACPVSIPLTDMIRRLRTPHPWLAYLWWAFPPGNLSRALASRVYRMRTQPPKGAVRPSGDTNRSDRALAESYPSSWWERWLRLLEEQSVDVLQGGPAPRSVKRVAGIGEAGVMVAPPSWINTSEDAVSVQGPSPFYPTLQAFLEAWDGTTPRVLFGGPSRTADIEKILVLGAHGPRKVRLWVTGTSEVPGVPRKV